MGSHGGAISDVMLPHSRFYHGLFGRMFRNLPAQDPAPAGNTDQAREQALQKIVNKMFVDSPTRSNDKIPAGYTYFGQFVNHDITFDPTSALQRQNDPDKLSNFRTPRFDLDSLYGSGPDGDPFMYDRYAKPKGLLLLGEAKMSSTNGDLVPSGKDDLPRNKQERAVIGDPRNDENLIISQLHLAFMKFHNRVMQELFDNGLKEPFAEAQRIVRWHYQYVVINDFLRRIVGQETFDKVFPIIDEERNHREPKLKVYKHKVQPFIPVEFSVAAFRLHTMVRTVYTLQDSGKQFFIFSDDQENNLAGERTLTEDKRIQWDKFFRIDGSIPQHSQLIDTQLAAGLKDVPSAGNLAFRNLLRGWRMGLPSGQAVSRAMGLLVPDYLDSKKNDPLWLYILREAESRLGDHGEHLGPIGGTIVAEVLLGLLESDPLSYLNVDPTWTPDRELAIRTLKDIAREQKKRDRDNPLPGQDPGQALESGFQLRDIVHYATK